MNSSLTRITLIEPDLFGLIYNPIYFKVRDSQVCTIFENRKICWTLIFKCYKDTNLLINATLARITLAINMWIQFLSIIYTNFSIIGMYIIERIWYHSRTGHDCATDKSCLVFSKYNAALTVLGHITV